MSGKMKFWIGVLIVLGLGAYFSNDSSDSKSIQGIPTKSVKKGKIAQEAYFKKNKQRIFVFSISSGTPTEQIRKHAKKQQNTSGKMTACYYYKDGPMIPRDGVTLASNMFKANEAINSLSSGIEYAYMKYANGSDEFINCRNNPTHGLCAEN